MVSVVERAFRILQDHPSPALPLDELVRLVRGSGALANEDVVLHAAVCRPDLFRVLDPWRGPWRTLGPRGRDGARVTGIRNPPPRSVRWSRAPGTGTSGGGSEPLRPGDSDPWWGDPRPWIVPAAPRVGAPPPDPLPTLGRMRESLVCLGRAVDETSARDLARWFGMVREGRRLRRIATSRPDGA